MQSCMLLKGITDGLLAILEILPSLPWPCPNMGFIEQG